MTTEETLAAKLDLVIAALERLAPPKAITIDLDAADCFVWEPTRLAFDPVANVNAFFPHPCAFCSRL